MDLITFKVNGVEHRVGCDVYSDTMLLDYLREYLQLRGTKYMCREGGCGACIVTAAKTPGSKQQAINSCLTSITSCHGWDIRTIEGLGNKNDPHVLQKTMTECSATQCGYCTPGWEMMMHGLMESNENMTMLDIEKSVSSNLCRCTGYRPILDAFKKFGIDAPKDDKITNVKEPLCCKPSGNCCQSSNTPKEDGWCMVEEGDLHEGNTIEIDLKDSKKWYRPTSLADVCELVRANLDSYMLVGGNTAKGAFPIDEYPKAMIDVHHLEELKVNELDQNLIVGTGHTLTELMGILKTYASQENFNYLSQVYDHIELVAHIPVRNVGTVAGNLMIKHTHNEFQSDVYLLFATVGAQLTIMDCQDSTENHTFTVTMPNFLKLDMKGKVIVNVMFPPMTSAHKLYSHKLMQRAQSTHAIVGFGFLVKLNDNNEVLEVKIMYSALSVNFEEAVSTERYLLGKKLFTNDTLQGALRVLDGEMIVDAHLPETSVEYRRYIAKALFYKALLILAPTRSARNESATIDLHLTRSLSSGKQTFNTDTSLWPLNKPMPKLEALIQCTGEAQYTDDIPSYKNEVFGAFVLSTVAKGTISKMDASKALALEGVIAFYTSKDIPGINSFTPNDSIVTLFSEEVFCEGTVKYHGQPVGMIVAETQNLAVRAAKLVTVKYINVTTPVTDIREAKKDITRSLPLIAIPAILPGLDIHKTIDGSNVIYGQYHFPMETMVCVAKPTEDGLEVHLSSQWLDGAHTMISRALNIPMNKIDLHIRRVGGAYGFKITRSNQCAVACSLIAYKLNRPCRVIQPLTTNMAACGKRMGNVNDYKVAVNKSGVIQLATNTLYEDNGHMINEPCIAYALDVYYNVYDVKKFTFIALNTKTDTPKHTFCRAPGTLEAIANVENILERISYELSLDPITVRLNNLNKNKYGEIEELVEALKTSAEFTSRKAAVDSFNTQNRWKKRGIRFSMCRWPPTGGVYLDVNLSVYHADGTVVITHGGVEMGQGINTKVAQVAAYLLKIPVEKIQIKGNNSVITPNTFVTGASITTDSIIIGLRRAIDQLQARLEPIKATLTDPSWSELITAAFAANIDLQAHGFASSLDAQTYDIFGVACCEVEVDVLTGKFVILRVDLLQDVGVSISPDVDIGQVEGAFMMGVGYWTCEKLVYDPNTGELLTNRSWDYLLGQARDIPQDFNVTLRSKPSNPLILGSKGVGEPPTCLSVVVTFAVREAMVNARKESGIPTTEWFDVDGPFTTEKVCLAMKTNTEDFKF